MKIENIETAPGHWLMAKMGKRVLRPGGVQLTNQLIDQLNISVQDDVVEFAPGLGFTAALVRRKRPKSWTGIELDETAATRLRKKIGSTDHRIVQANASSTGLQENSINRVYGEAMLTMQSEKRKAAIIQEAYRILKPGGYYGVHEIALSPDNLPEEKQSEIQKDLIESIKVNARPVTMKAWLKHFEDAGFEVVTRSTTPMHLLEPKRLIQDEGILRVIKIRFNMMLHPKIAKRIRKIKATFQKHSGYMNAFMAVVRKPQ
ncbi:class I SAM-dependent methyltransferase [Rubellicoccus peritrichatus]|uniref:Class I SAM-dependent methyltransferase n=1 Tax=Rubellicoccus peritrichatus TaxID=3080537 RepID=A0AAQ3LAJ1_9BACT|nr:class I SAM-dependent methyltransferase [Puniceicoccus sp. CR14]WOO40657.1 class I SAM-dependent methyltransferase [Puniceicoccus sp. CR14]